jgi:alpha-D-ribose 1-methylphosphonate 5-triphosphate diphosphatase
MSTEEMLLSDARLVLPDRVIERGWVAVAEGGIVEIGEGAAPGAALSMGGDTLIPGLVELHTDHLEVHAKPRPSVKWHPLSAVLAYDAQIAAAGITTVFDCLRCGGDGDNIDPNGVHIEELARTLKAAEIEDLLRSEHRTHLRCEVCSPDVVKATERFLSRNAVHLISLMDHTPGQRQFRDAEKLRVYYRGKTGKSEAQLDAFFAERQRLHDLNSVRHHNALVAIAHGHGIVLASHDDTTPDHVTQSVADGARIAEFPTTREAAAASHAAGIAVMMGAPNLVRGGSHSGNVAAEELAQDGTLDIFSSDYVPASLILAAFDLASRVPRISLPEAIATVTLNPARAVGLDDRGAIAVGKRADLVRVHMSGIAVVRTVWREGRRVV